MAYIFKKWTLATVQVVYYIPDYLHIVNEFSWQTEDRQPEYPRIKKFLDYWDKNIDGPIKDVYILDHDAVYPHVRHVDRRYMLN
jgi:uncharacterized protein Usg